MQTATLFLQMEQQFQLARHHPIGVLPVVRDAKPLKLALAHARSAGRNARLGGCLQLLQAAGTATATAIVQMLIRDREKR